MACTPIRIFDRLVNGMVSVGLNALEFVIKAKAMTLVAHTCSAASSKLDPLVSVEETSMFTSRARLIRFVVTISAANISDTQRDHRVCLVSRHGLVALPAASSAGSSLPSGPVPAIDGRLV